MRLKIVKKYEKDAVSGQRFPTVSADIEFSMDEIERLRMNDDKLSRSIARSLMKTFADIDFVDGEEMEMNLAVSPPPTPVKDVVVEDAKVSEPEVVEQLLPSKEPEPEQV